MQKLNINGKKYSLPESAADFLKKYLERLREYTHDKKIDLELYQDIEERISEKLDILSKKVTQKDVVDIVNSLGEPEEIFSDYENEESPLMDKITKNGESFFKIIKEKTGKAADYSKKKFKAIQKKIDDKKVVEKVKTKSKNVFNNIKTKTEEQKATTEETEHKTEKGDHKTVQPERKKSGFFVTIGRVVQAFFDFIFRLIGKIIRMIQSIFIFILGILGTIFIYAIKFAEWVFHFLFFSVFGIFFLAFFITLLVIAPLTYANIVIGNQELFAYVPTMTQWSFVILFVSSAILMASAVNAALKHKWVPKFLSFIASIAFFIGMFGTLIGVYTVANEYSNGYTKTYDFEFPEYQNAEIVLENFSFLHQHSNKNSFDLKLPPDRTYLTLKKSPDSNLRFEINANIRAQNQTKADKILAELEPIQIKQNDNIFTISRAENNIFKNVVPFSFLIYQVKIYVPENVKIDLNDEYWPYIGNANLYYNLDSKNEYGYLRCNKPLIYNAEIGRFICSEFEKRETEESETNHENEFTETGAVIEIDLAEDGNLEVESEETTTGSNVIEVDAIEESSTGSLIEVTG